VVIKNRVGEVAAQQGLSTQDLADKAGIAYNTALGLMRGVSTRIDLAVFDRVCDALNSTPGELLVKVGKAAQE
jgi:DNA-binding Xre family transcriptional regulator